VFEQQLRQEVLDDFDADTSTANYIGRSSTKDVATVYIDRSGYARGIVGNQLASNALSADTAWWDDEVAENEKAGATRRVRIEDSTTTTINNTNLSPKSGESISDSDESSVDSHDLNRTRSSSRMGISAIDDRDNALDEDSIVDSEEVILITNSSATPPS
jgi:hypothetical protein